MYTVYMHTAPNGKRYIGITSQKPETRWKCGYGYKRNYYFFNAIKKYSWDNIKHEILFENLTKEEAEQKEIELIAEYRSNQREYGYNISNGGNCIGTHSEETKNKISESLKGKPLSEEHKKKMSEALKGEKAYWYGKHHSEESKKKMSESLKGKPLSEEHKNKLSEAFKGEKSYWYGKHHSEESKKKMSESHKGEKSYWYGKRLPKEIRQKISESHKGEKNPMYGKQHSEEHKKKIGEALKGRQHSEETKKKIGESLKGRIFSEETKKKLSKQIICLETGICYSSVTLASKTLNITAGNISSVCRGKRKTTGGYHFKYAS